MTDKHDKLVEMARASSEYHLSSGSVIMGRDELAAFRAAFRAAIIADLYGDVETVAWLHKQGAHTELSERELLEDEKERGWTQKPLYPASTVAALKAENDALRARVAELERNAETIAATERERICAAIKAEDDHCAGGDYMLDSDDCIKVARGQWVRPVWDAPYAALTKGQPAPQPQQEQSK